MGTLASLAVVVFRGIMAARLATTGDGASIVLAASEGWALVATALGLFRHSIDQRPSAALVPVLYCAPLLLSPSRNPETFWLGCLLSLMLFQLVLRLYMGLHLTVGAPGFRALLDAGPYKYVRHPLAACEIGIVSCYALHSPTAWNVAWSAACIVLAVCVALLEERHLTRFRAYRQYCDRVTFRFLPGVA